MTTTVSARNEAHRSMAHHVDPTVAASRAASISSGSHAPAASGESGVSEPGGPAPTSLEQIDLALVDVADNVRKDAGDLSELTDSIRIHGVLQPVAVCRLGNGRYRLREPLDWDITLAVREAAR